jgi:hypothetical protein
VSPSCGGKGDVRVQKRKTKWRGSNHALQRHILYLIGIGIAFSLKDRSTNSYSVRVKIASVSNIDGQGILPVFAVLG